MRNDDANNREARKTRLVREFVIFDKRAIKTEFVIAYTRRKRDWPAEMVAFAAGSIGTGPNVVKPTSGALPAERSIAQPLTCCGLVPLPFWLCTTK